MHKNTLASVSSLHLPCLGMLKASAAKGNIDTNDGAAAEMRSISSVWERWGGSLHSQPQGCSRTNKLNKAETWPNLCISNCGIKFSPISCCFFWPVPLSRWCVGTFWSSTCQRLPAASRDPYLRARIYTYRRMEAYYVVPLLGVAVKARFYLMHGKTCLKFFVWNDSHIFLLRSIFDSNAGM